VPSLPKVNVPVVVTTEGVDKGLKDAERKMRASAQRMQKPAPSAAAGVFKAAGQSALGIGGFGAIGGAVGAMGTAGIGIAGALSPIIAAGAIMDALSTATKGAGDALAKFKETGEQTIAANSVILERLAILEKQAKEAERGGFLKSLIAASADAQTGRAGGAVAWAQQMSEGSTIAGAGIGAFLSGKSLEQIRNEMALSVANEAGAFQIKQRMNEQSRIDIAEGRGGMADAIGAWMIQNSALLTKLVQVTS
jgi:hypothetical protein